VVDSAVIVASFLEGEPNHQRGREIISGLETGEYELHLPTIVVVEVSSAIRRQSAHRWRSLLTFWNRTILDWERNGKLVLYPLDRTRMELAVAVARRHRLRGADSVIAALSEELNIPLKTFDREILARFPLASS
jgi:predicted nucleic acid-binding protein